MDSCVSNAKNDIMISVLDDVQRLGILVRTKKHVNNFCFIFSFSRITGRFKESLVSKSWNWRGASSAFVFRFFDQAINRIPNEICKQKSVFFWPKTRRDKCSPRYASRFITSMRVVASIEQRKCFARQTVNKNATIFRNGSNWQS